MANSSFPWLSLLMLLSCAAAGCFIGKRRGQPIGGAIWGLILGPIGIFIASFAKDMRPRPQMEAPAHITARFRAVQPSEIEDAYCTLCGKKSVGMWYYFWHCQVTSIPARYHGLRDYHHYRRHSSVSSFVCKACATRYSESSILPKLVGGWLLILLGGCSFVGLPLVAGIPFALSGIIFVWVGHWERRGVTCEGSTAYPKSLQDVIVDDAYANALDSKPGRVYGVWYDTYVTDAQYKQDSRTRMVDDA